MPDLVLLKDGVIKFVEVKSNVDKLSERQERAFKLLKKHGFLVEIERVDLKLPPSKPSMSPLSKQTVQVDERGRITIPDYLREAADMSPGSLVEIAADPDLKDMKCKGLTLRRAF